MTAPSEAARARREALEEAAMIADRFVAEQEAQSKADTDRSINLHALRLAAWDTAKKTAAAIRALADASPAGESGWQDISTAPKDGSTILAYFPLEGLGEYWCRVVPVYWHGAGTWTFASRACSGFSQAYQPTHWRPLPLPPAEKE